MWPFKKKRDVQLLNYGTMTQANFLANPVRLQNMIPPPPPLPLGAIGAFTNLWKQQTAVPLFAPPETEKAEDLETLHAITAVRAWRVWLLSCDFSLTSYHKNHTWLPGWNVAYCEKGPFDIFRSIPKICQVPELSCGCGFYALGELDFSILDSTKLTVALLGQTELAGKVIEHEKGYRGQLARIQSLVWPPITTWGVCNVALSLIQADGKLKQHFYFIHKPITWNFDNFLKLAFPCLDFTKCQIHENLEDIRTEIAYNYPDIQFLPGSEIYDKINREQEKKICKLVSQNESGK